MRWEQIASVHRIAAVKALAIWFILTPLLARLFESDPLAKFAFGFQLPFNLYLFYAASMVFFIATVIYGTRCPRIIRNYEGWSAYRAAEGSYEKLIPLMVEVLGRTSNEQRDQFLRRHADLHNIALRDAANKPIEPYSPDWKETTRDYAALLARSQVTPEHLNDVFSATREAAQNIRPVWLRAILGLHIIGWTLLAWVLGQNALAVLKSACNRYPPSFELWGYVCQRLQG